MKIGVSYWRMVWPESGPLLAGVGGIIGLLSDVGSFVGDISAPWVWAPVVLGLLLAVLLFAPCRNRVVVGLPEQQDAAYDCRFCNVFRVGLFACLVCAMLALAGQVVTMVVIGLWHGVSGHFVLWGLWHGIGLFVHKWWSDRTRNLYLALRDQPRRARALEIAGVVLTFHFVALGWVWFALPDVGIGWRVFWALFGG